MKIHTIYLDMDGVLANFVGAAARAFGFTEAELLKRWVPGEYSVHKPLGLEAEHLLWARLNLKGRSFWSEIELYPWAEELWALCSSFAPTFIATSPARDPDSSAGKVEWLQRWRGTEFRDYVITPKKELLATPGALLIDDLEANVDKWRERGGRAVLFPQIWNASHPWISERVDTVRMALKLPEML